MRKTDAFTEKLTFEPYEGTEPYIFISYSHSNSQEVYRILNRLNKEKFRVWFDDTMEIGEDFRDELREKIEDCSAFIIFISNASMSSKYCGMEIITAFKNNKKIYPVYVEENVEIPAALKMMLENLQHVKGVSTENEDKYITKMISNLPVETMRSLIIKDNVLVKCKDGSQLINIPDNVKVIGHAAFKNCEKLSIVNISESVEIIQDEAFRGCKGIQKLFLPKKVKLLGSSAFRDCISLTSLDIENSDIEIGERAFENCQVLKSINLPNGLAEIYGGVFNSCKMLEEITLPEELIILGESSFASCVRLKKIEVPEGVTKIDDMAFSGCVSLKEVILKPGLNKIGKNTFKECESLTEIFIPAAVYSIGTGPFRGCVNLKKVVVDSKNKSFKSVDDVLFNKNKSVLICYPASKDKYEYEIPDSVTIISDWSFCDCSKLNKIIIPDSVTEIGEGAFHKCDKLKSVEIPDSVYKIDDTAFRGCSSLEKVLIPDSVTEFGWGLFNGCDKLVVYCSDDSRAAKYCDKKHIEHRPISDFGMK